MWVLNLRLESRVTPRYFVCFDQLMAWSLILILSMLCFTCLLKMRATVFCGLIFRRHLSNHWMAMSTCFYNWIIARLSFLFFVYSRVSSANRAIDELGVMGMSLV